MYVKSAVDVGIGERLSMLESGFRIQLDSVSSRKMRGGFSVSELKRICEQLWALEQDLDLFQSEIQGIHFWKLVRTRVFQNIMMAKGIHDQANHTVERGRFSKVTSIFGHLKNYVQHGLKKPRKRDVLIFNHPRKVLVDGKYIDIYTEQFVKSIEASEQSYLVIDRPTNWHKHYISPNENVVYSDDADILSRVMVRFLRMYRVKPNAQELALLDRLSAQLKASFGSDGKLYHVTMQQINLFKIETDYYKKILDFVEPKKIYVVIGRGFEALIAEANRRGIDVFEIQHGIITKYNLDYSFPGQKEIPYFPNGMVVFGKYWYMSTPMPIKEQNIVSFGSPYLLSRIAAYSEYVRNEKQVVFISQSTIGKKLMPYVLRLAQKRPDLSVLVKLHPTEFPVWKEHYPELLEAQQLANVEVVDTFDKNLFELFATSAYQIGVYSTALYEGIYMGCKTILVDLPGVEHLEYLFENQYAQLVDTPDACVAALEQPFAYNANTTLFFQSEQ